MEYDDFGARCGGAAGGDAHGGGYGWGREMEARRLMGADSYTSAGSL